jgi:hypothetical protein
VLETDEPLCQTCIHASRCKIVRDQVFECYWHITKEEQIKAEQRERDLINLVNTREYAQELLNKIEDIIFCPEPYTGNAGTNYNMGMRRVVMNDITTIMNALKMVRYTELIVYLQKIITGGK